MTKHYHFEARFFPQTGAVKPWEVWSVNNETGELISKGPSYKTEKAANAAVKRNHEFFSIVWTGKN